MGSRWPRDFAACAGDGCPKRENCRRFRGHEQSTADSNHRQVYMFPPDDPENCAEFWPEAPDE